jgi:adenosylmethionine-8-amino-7-oxononanoate aminotransferase
MITMAKGLTSGYAPLGAVVIRDEIAEPFMKEGGATFMHGITFGGHPVSCAVALANLAVFEREDIIGNVRAMEPKFREALESLYDLPIVGDVRGDGFLFGIEFVKDQATRQRFDNVEADRVIAALDAGLMEAGLICRADRRGDLVLTLAPPLICGESEIDFIHDCVRKVITNVVNTVI